MKGIFVTMISCAVILVACLSCVKSKPDTLNTENLNAKAMLQGIWVEDNTDEIVFKVEGDTIYYPDNSSQPSYFRIINDSLELGGYRYAVVQQSEHFFCFQNQTGDDVKLRKSTSQADSLAFCGLQPEMISSSAIVKRDSVVLYNGERYHWYVVVNPTKYQVTKTSYNSEGVGVENVYYDNIIHISLYHGAKRLFSRDMKKQMYEDKVPKEFLSQAILGGMTYDYIDAKGVHFNATLCIPEEASCYMVETLVGFDGQLSMNLLEY